MHDQASSLDAHSLGSAAALQIVKNFTSGSESHAGGDVRSQLIGQAMAEALKLFDSSGAKGNKQDAVNSAAMTMTKLMVQSKFSGAGTTGGNSSSTLMDLVRSLQMCPALALIISYRPASLFSSINRPMRNPYLVNRNFSGYWS